MEDKIQEALDKVVSELKSLTFRVPVCPETAMFVEQCVHAELKDNWKYFRVVFKGRELVIDKL